MQGIQQGVSRMRSPRHELPRPVAYFPLNYPSSRQPIGGLASEGDRFVESIPIPGMATFLDGSVSGSASAILVGTNMSRVFFGELHGNISFVPDAAFGSAMQCNENSRDYVKILPTDRIVGSSLRYGAFDGQFAINLWFKRAVGYGYGFEYLFSHGGTDFPGQQVGYDFTPNQVQLYIPESSHPAHGIVRAIVKDSTDSSIVSFLDSDGRYNDNTDVDRNLKDHIDTDDGHWHMVTLTTFPRRAGETLRKGYQLYIDGKLGGEVSSEVAERYLQSQQRAGIVSNQLGDSSGGNFGRRRALRQLDWTSSTGAYDYEYSETDSTQSDFLENFNSPYNQSWLERENDALAINPENPFASIPFQLDGGEKLSIDQDAPIFLCGRSDLHPERHFGGRIARLAIYDQSLTPGDITRLYLAAPLHLEADIRNQERDERAMRNAQAEELGLSGDEILAEDDAVQNAEATIELPERDKCSTSVAQAALSTCWPMSDNPTFDGSCCQSLFESYAQKTSETMGCMCYATHSSIELPAQWMQQVLDDVETGNSTSAGSPSLARIAMEFCFKRVNRMVAEEAAEGDTIGAARKEQLQMLCVSTVLLQRKMSICESVYGYQQLFPYRFAGPFVVTDASFDYSRVIEWDLGFLPHWRASSSPHIRSTVGASSSFHVLHSLHSFNRSLIEALFAHRLVII